METLGNKNLPQFCYKFYCNYCHYGTSKKSSFDDHVLSQKHKKSINGNKMETNGNNILPKFCYTNFSCEKCQREFKSRSGLWKHNKICINNEIYVSINDTELNTKNNIDYDENLINYLIKKNQNLKNLILEIMIDKSESEIL